jgi:uncharacterized protein (DUF2132 family)
MSNTIYLLASTISQLILKMNDKSNPDSEQLNNPLHGIKLADILEQLEADYGWEELGKRINIRCFNYDPSIKSSLKFLRKTPWARDKVEQLYLRSIKNSKGKIIFTKK